MTRFFAALRLLHLATLVLGLCLSPIINAAPVWKISNGEHHFFMAGTVHLLSKSDFPLPPAFEKAYQQSDVLIFETDMAAMGTTEFQYKMLRAMTYSDGTTLKDVLSPQTLQALEVHLRERNLSLQNFMSFKASMLYVNLSVIELQRIGLTAAGVDQYYSEQAGQDGKPQKWLESPDTQLAFLSNLGKGEEDNLIAYTLKDLKRLPEIITQLKGAWRAGDLAQLDSIGIEEFKQGYPNVYDDLLKKRNQNWLPALEKMFTTPETEFVLVGALHLAGEDSVFTLLKNKGYTIEQLP